MVEDIEQPNIEDAENLEVAEDVSENLEAIEIAEELPLDEQADVFLDEQDAELAEQESGKDRKILSALKEWAAKNLKD